MKLTTSAHISLAKGGREDESYHVSKEELKVFSDSINDRDCRHTGRESFGIRLSGSNPSSVTY